MSNPFAGHKIGKAPALASMAKVPKARVTKPTAPSPSFRSKLTSVKTDRGNFRFKANQGGVR